MERERGAAPPHEPQTGRPGLEWALVVVAVAGAMLWVLALIGILLAVVVPNLGGFFGRGKDRAYDADRRLIQAAVDVYYTDFARRPGVRRYPTAGGYGAESASANAYVNFTHLVGETYLRNVPDSASSHNPGGSRRGTYSWWVQLSGVVTSTPTHNGRYP